MGNTLTKFAVKKIEQRQEGISTLGSLNIWYDETVQRLNTDERGVLLGAFSGADRIITLMQTGHYRLTSFDLSTHFDEEMIRIEKFDSERIYTAVYQEHETRLHYVKRFRAELSEKKVEFIESPDRLVLLTADRSPRLEILFDMKVKLKGNESEEIRVSDFIGVKGYKAKGKRLALTVLRKVSWMASDPEEELPEDQEMIPGEAPVPLPFRIDSVDDEPEVPGDTAQPEPMAGPGFESAAVAPPAFIPVISPEETDSVAPELLSQVPPDETAPVKKNERKKRTESPAAPSKDAPDAGNTGQMELPL
jgi:topoisomerase-4 subunit A